MGEFRICTEQATSKRVFMSELGFGVKLIDTSSGLAGDEMRLRALEAFRQGRFADAITAYVDVANRYPDSAEAHAALGRALEAADFHKEAALALGAALHLNPRDLTTAKNLAKVMLRLGQPDVARSLFFSVLEMHPADGEACHGMALLEDSLGNLDEGSSWYGRLRSINPSHPDAWKTDAPVCNVCGERGAFKNPTPDNIRESLWCKTCNSLNRDRFMTFVLSRLLHEQGPMRTWKPRKEIRVLEADGHRGHPRFLESNYEYYNTRFAQNVLARGLDPASFADLQELHFQNGFFDIMITCDVFEHVRLHREALNHVFRVLKPGGACILQIPYCHELEHTVVRVQPDGDRDINLLPVQYHGDDSLVYRDYGRDFLQELSELGFHVYYLEGEVPASLATRQSIIVIERPGPRGPSHPFAGLDESGFTTFFLPSKTDRVASFLREIAPEAGKEFEGTGLSYDHSRYHYYFELGHAERITETLKRSAQYLAGASSALDLGSTGDVPVILRRFYGVGTVIINGMADDVVSYAAPVASGAPDVAEGSTVQIRGWDIEREVFPLESGSLDVVTCLEVLEHLRSDPLFAVREANRVLRVGGYFILTTPNLNSMQGMLRMAKGLSPALFATFNADGSGIIHAREYAPGELRVLLEHGGFRVLDLQTFDAYWYDPAEVEQALPLLQAMAASGWKPNLGRQVSFIVGQKISDPCSSAYVPLYTADIPAAQSGNTGAAGASAIQVLNPAASSLDGHDGNMEAACDTPAADPMHPEALLKRAMDLRRACRPADAERTLRNILVFHPGWPGVRRTLAEIAHERGDIPAALNELFAALQEAPEDLDTAALLSRLLMDAGQDLLAVRLLTEAVVKAPDHTGILTGLGKLHAKHGKVRYAREYLACVLRLAPGCDEARLALEVLGDGDGCAEAKDALLDQQLEAARIPNNLLLRKEFLANKAVIAALPDFVIADPTSICNAKCITCFHSFEDLPWQDLPRECFDKLKHLFSTASQINLFGSGEPFVAREFPYELAEALRLKRPSTSLTVSSNGKILREKHIAMLMEPGITLQVSIDAATPELFNHIRRGIDFGKFMENLKLFTRMRGKGKNPRLTFSCTISKRNLAELPKIFALAKELHVDFVGLFNEYALHPSEQPYILDEHDAPEFDRLRREFELSGVPYGNFLTSLTARPSQVSFPWKEPPASTATV